MFDPYHKWLGIPKNQRPPTYYQLLGISPEETDSEVITEAALRQTAHVRNYQSSPHAQQCAELLNEIGQAKSILLNAARRKEYDARLAQKKGAIPSGSRTNIPTPVARPTAPAPWAGTPMANLCESLVRNGLYTLEELRHILEQWIGEASDPGNVDRFRRWLSTRPQQQPVAENPPLRAGPGQPRRDGSEARPETVVLPGGLPAPPVAPLPQPSAPAAETGPGGTSSTSETDLGLSQSPSGDRPAPLSHGLTRRDCLAFTLGAVGTVGVAVLIKLLGLLGRRGTEKE